MIVLFVFRFRPLDWLGKKRIETVPVMPKPKMPKSIPINVYSELRGLALVFVPLTERISFVKREAFATFKDLRVLNERILYNGQELSDHKIVLDCGLKEHACLELISDP